jgi:transposase
VIVARARKGSSRSKTGEAISDGRRTRAAQRKLWALRDEANSKGDLATWRRAKAVLGYIKGKSVISLAETLDVTRGAINRWLQWYELEGVDGLRTLPVPGSAPRLDAAQQQELITLVEAGPQSAGYSTGIWTGPMIGDLIHHHFGVRYHNHHVPWVLHRLGFSVQRPRKRLARADLEKQEYWLRNEFPAIKKKPLSAEETSSSRMKPASGSMARSTVPGRE